MPSLKKTAPVKKAAPRPARKTAARTSSRKSAPKRTSFRRWIVPALSLVLFGYGLYRLIAHYSGEVDRELHGAIRQHRATGTARVIAVQGGKEPRVQFQFLHRGIPYERWQPAPERTFQMHLCYGVEYDSTRPGRAVLIEGSATACPGGGMMENKEEGAYASNGVQE
ncbi:hypothetical protein [Flaviaesturariibacter amylovorans]|uniref:DUF3592 domain-containing protein n=1 Tax=Flaviaesturariibacter amylovorans TaxID=1084520 RepID=A0ABP8HTA6_9BACT